MCPALITTFVFNAQKTQASFYFYLAIKIWYQYLKIILTPLKPSLSLSQHSVYNIAWTRQTEAVKYIVMKYRGPFCADFEGQDTQGRCWEMLAKLMSFKPRSQATKFQPLQQNIMFHKPDKK